MPLILIVQCILLIQSLSACQIPTAQTRTPKPTDNLTGTKTPFPTNSSYKTTTATPEITPDIINVLVNFAKPIGNAPPVFGVNGWWTDEDAQMWQERYFELAPEVVRVPIFQAVIEPQNDDADPAHANSTGFQFNTPFPIADDRHVTYSKWFQALQQSGATIMIYIPYLAPWLSQTENSSPLEAPYPPNDLAEYQEFIEVTLSFLIDEIGFSPDNIILEPVNEPDLTCGADPAVPCFWRDLQIEDLNAVLEAASYSAKNIDSNIQLAGPALCCNISVLDQLMDSYSAADYLDILTFHSYVQGGFNLNSTFNLANQLRKYEKPTYLDEYGSTAYWSNGEEGAIWHAAALGEFWKAGLSPIQFSMAELPVMHPGYNELGLFSSWQEGWQIKPAYWVYVNFFNTFQYVELVSFSSPEGMLGIAGKIDGQHLAIWVTNRSYSKADNIVLSVENWEANTAQIQVIDNLNGSSPINIFNLSVTEDGTLTFFYPIPTLDSYLFLISVPENQ